MNLTRILGRGALAAVTAASLLGVAAGPAAARGIQFTVTIDQSAGQADPTTTSPILFTVEFSSTTADFATGDVSLSGTAGATTATVTSSGNGTTYTVNVSGMTSTGTVIATIAAGVAHSGANQANSASTSDDNTVQYNLPPDTTTSTTTSTTTTLAPTTTSAATTTTVAPVLPVTGSRARSGSAVAVLLVAAGAGLLLLARRRGHPTA